MLATFQVLISHIWLVATILDRIEIISIITEGSLSTVTEDESFCLGKKKILGTIEMLNSKNTSSFFSIICCFQTCFSAAY